MAANLLTVISFLCLLLLVPSQAYKFWQISDLHLDLNYDVDGDPSKNNWCHKNISETSEKSPLLDAGNYNCDAPLLLIKSLLKAMHELEPNPDFIIWTGDNAPHAANPEADYHYITNVTSWVFREIHALFGEEVTVIPALGNHDAYPADSYIDAQNATEEEVTQYKMYWNQGGFGKHIDGDENEKSFKRCGYYTKNIKLEGVDLKFVVLNTNIYYNNPNVAKVSDPCDQLDWLKKTLEEAGDSEKVYLMAHVPPGTFELNPNSSFFNSPASHAVEIEKNYVSIVSDPNLYMKIQAHFYGHAHTDTFRLFTSRSGDDEVRGVGFLASSGTPLLWGKEGTVVGVNPGMRLFQMKEDGTLKDYQQYGLDLAALQNNGETVAKSASEEHNSVNASVQRTKREEDPRITAPTAAVPGLSAPETQAHKKEAQTEIGPTNNATTLLGHQGENPTAGGGSVAPLAPTTVASTSSSSAKDESSLNYTAIMLGLNASTSQSRVDELAKRFKLIYKATEAFGILDLSFVQMGKAFNNMAQNPSIFNAYYAHNTLNHANTTCDKTCIRGQMCTIKHVVIEEFKKCFDTNVNKTEVLPVNFPTVEPNVTPTTPTTTPIPTPTPTSTPLSPSHSTDAIITPAITTTARNPKFTTLATTTTTSSTPPPTTEKVVEPATERETDNVEKEATEGNDTSSKVAGIFLGVAGALIMVIVIVLLARKYARQRRRDQEFLLTDSVFRYDGYNQLDEDF